MPTTYEFLTFSDINGMRNAPAKRQIRQHAMKAIGVSRRKWRGRKYPLQFVPKQVYAGETATQPINDSLPILNDNAIYNSYIRTMSCKMDPFGTASVPVDATVHGLLRYFIYYSSNFPNNFTFTPNVRRFLTYALQDTLLIHCVLSAAASRIQYVEALAPVSFRERELLSTQHSVKLLQSELQCCRAQSHASRERLVNCMLYLGAGAIYRHDIPTAKIHINAAVELVELMGGVSILQDPQVLVRVISLDDLLSCIDLEPCKIKPDYDPGGLPLLGLCSKWLTRDVDPLPIGFVATDQSVLPPALRSLVLHVIECHQIKCALEMSDSRWLPTALIQRQQLKLQTLATRNRLLAFCTSDSRTEAIRLSLIMCTLLPPSDVRQIRTAQGVARRLMRLLERTSEPAWMGLERIRFWCLLIGYYCAKPGDAASAWFLSDICQTIYQEGTSVGVQIGPRVSSELIELQEDFLVDELTIKPLTGKLAERVMGQPLCLA